MAGLLLTTQSVTRMRKRLCCATCNKEEDPLTPLVFRGAEANIVNELHLTAAAEATE